MAKQKVEKVVQTTTKRKDPKKLYFVRTAPGTHRGSDGMNYRKGEKFQATFTEMKNFMDIYDVVEKPSRRAKKGTPILVFRGQGKWDVLNDTTGEKYNETYLSEAAGRALISQFILGKEVDDDETNDGKATT